MINRSEPMIAENELKESLVATTPVASTILLKKKSRSAPSLWKSVILPAVEAELAEVQAVIQTATRCRSSEINELYETTAPSGGKKLRPTLAILAHKASLVGRPPAHSRIRNDDLLYSAAAVELVHMASLVHDDVMDSADVRQHRPTVAKVAGGASAVLLGDYLFTRAYDLAARCRSPFAARCIAKAAAALCEGELLQQRTAGNWAMKATQYRRVLALKTGALCAAACRLGAWSAGIETLKRKALTQYGMKLGIAFQVFDDWLDYWGEECVGKTLGTDLAQCKPTLPTIRLLAQLRGSARREVLAELKSPTRDSLQHFRWIRSQLDSTDASNYTRAKAVALAENSVRTLQAIEESEYLRKLSDIANFSVARHV
ncbi:MAG: polyprenyl synthetase family protein [Planctomycetota bacterium]